MPYKKTESKRRPRENLKRAINNMVDNLKSCNLQGTAAQTHGHTNRYRYECEWMSQPLWMVGCRCSRRCCCCCRWTFLLSWLRPTQSQAQQQRSMSAAVIAMLECSNNNSDNNFLQARPVLKAWQAMPRPRPTPQSESSCLVGRENRISLACSNRVFSPWPEPVLGLAVAFSRCLSPLRLLFVPFYLYLWFQIFLGRAQWAKLAINVFKVCFKLDEKKTKKNKN